MGKPLCSKQEREVRKTAHERRTCTYPSYGRMATPRQSTTRKRPGETKRFCFRKCFEAQLIAESAHVGILARDPSTTKSEGFSLLCQPAWGGSPFLSDLVTLAYANVTMSTPGLKWTRHPHPADSDTLTAYCTPQSPTTQAEASCYKLTPLNPVITQINNTSINTEQLGIHFQNDKAQNINTAH